MQKEKRIFEPLREGSLVDAIRAANNARKNMVLRLLEDKRTHTQQLLAAISECARLSERNELLTSKIVHSEKGAVTTTSDSSLIAALKYSVRERGKVIEKLVSRITLYEEEIKRMQNK